MFGTLRTIASQLRLFHTTPKASASKTQFFVYAPDYPNSIDRRYAVRERHLAEVKEPIERGVIRVGGLLADPEQPKVEAGEQTRWNATGSILIVEAETLEEVKQLIHNDIYWTSGVWDKERLTIQRFAAATPFP